ncbi:concanavalin A-like lectin/glucanase domain-containing protein [Lipomyces orientalis]|uniref:Concanavalin A-like lectin/glucanase domain-containing protein n=1 Tax=Lipomyces orientalis TaxID=1233043 RepID=A0ACC3TWM6_9ASCO
MLGSVCSRVAAGVFALAILPAALAAITCDADNLCPESAPCCSQYGECGIGAYCLGGCNPKFSYQVESCAPQPICVDNSYTFDNLDSLESNTKYLGDSSQVGFVYTGYPLESDGNLLATMPNGSVGTVIATSTYVWYGKVDVVMKSSRGQGVVTAFILFSDVQDEIDWEFVGADLGTVQTNYYYQGILDWFNSQNISLSDTFANWHTYSVDWQQDYIQWSVDGQVGRTLYKNATYNATSGEYMFPQTPSRVQLSIWPGGLASNAPGTIAWAGGEINWNSEDIQEVGYDYAMIKSIDVQCYSPPSFVNQSGGKSYRYLNRNGTQESVVITDDDTVLASFEASGTDMNAGESSSSSAASSSSTTSAASSIASSSTTSSSSQSIPNASEVEQSSSAEPSTSSVPSIPGGSGGGNDLERGSSSSQSIPDASEMSESSSSSPSSSSGASTSSSASSVTSPATTATATAGSGFSQGGSTTSTNAGTVVTPGFGLLVVSFITFISGFLFVI